MATLPGPEGWWFRCAGGGRRHSDAYEWAVPAERLSAAHEGICADSGLYDDLPNCVHRGDPWVEHGIVEHRYKLARPDVYRELVGIYGHVAVAPKQYTASALIAGALGQLTRDGIIAASTTRLPATGFWKYNTTLTYWGAVPGPADDTHLTWSAYADAHGLDPVLWTIP